MALKHDHSPKPFAIASETPSQTCSVTRLNGNTGKKAQAVKREFSNMWHRVKNSILSLKTYGILSPDLRVRQDVNRLLRDRPSLSADEWFELHCKPLGIRTAVAHFAYSHLAKYSGLKFSKVYPSDRLEEDLSWTQVCWFDWEINLCDDFYRCFEIDISDRLYDCNPITIKDLLIFLNALLDDSHT